MSHFRTLTEIAFELSHRLPPRSEEGQVFFLAQSEKEAVQLRALCQYFVSTFPEECIVSPLFLEEHTLTKEQFDRRTLHLKSGKTLPISDLTQQLTLLGFERWPRAVSPRSFAVRGNIVDLIDRQASRLEYTGNTIEQIRQFNISTQASGGTSHDLIIFPLAYSQHLPLWTETNLQFEFITPKFYHKRFPMLKQDAAAYLQIKVATAHPEQVVALLPNATISLPARGLEGFVYPADHLLFLTDEHIFGAEETIATFTNPLDISNLEIGDYVVHIDHGIGLFEGIKSVAGEDYITLRYLKNDKLLVPMSAANRVEKYLGQAQPKLTRLSGTQWETMVHRVQDDVRHTAKELLELHAQRAGAHATIIPTKLHQEEIDCANDVSFTLTADQEQAVTDILADLNNAKPMDRLLCGDVGFGKTEVALRAALHVAIHGGQTIILAPTTILADQHWHTFRHRLEKYGLSVGGVSRLHTPPTGAMDILVGTHKLLSTKLDLKKLQLLVIDEEQRFGVMPKERLKALRQSAHVLTMTATPIPRTLNLAMSGLRDISVLNTAPPLRVGVKTMINEFNLELELQAIQTELERRGQIYIVHNDLGTIHARESVIRQHFPQYTVAVAHGRLPADQLIQIMERFYSGQIDILIASTIIENGLDIANANTLIVEHAEQFGLAQLYQLRGRIGRSDVQGYAYLLYQPQALSKAGQNRLRALHSIKELGGGFELAMKDLEIRGVGDILGKKQHGHVQQIGLNLYTRLLHQAVLQLQHTS